MRRPTTTVPDDLLRPALEYDAPRRKDNLFVWTVFLLLLVGFSMTCWIGSYLVFSRPELPFSYKLLRKIHKIDAPQRFAVTKAPGKGEFKTAEQLYGLYNALSGPDLRQLNRELERNYLRNYSSTTETVTYITGRFTIMDSYELGSTDFVTSGAVALAVSTDFPRVMIEHIYSSSPQDAPLIQHNLQTGLEVELRRTYELSAVLHVARLTDGHLQLTVVPINYGRYIFTGTSGGFELQPPSVLNVAAGWPIVRGDRLAAGNQAYLDFRTHSGQGPLLAHSADGQKAPPTAFKGVDLPADPPPGNPLAKGGLPDGGKKPLAGASPMPGAMLAQAPVTVARALPVDEPPRRAAATPPSILKAAPVQPLGGGGVSLQPFLAGGSAGGVAPPVAAATAVVRSWPTYAAGQMPLGRSIRTGEIASLNERGGLGNEPTYLTGQFVVRAAGENKEKGIKRAYMRASSGDAKIRLLVDYPADRPLPSEGTEVTRDEQRPYQIMEVRQGADGALNVYVREIIE